MKVHLLPPTTGPKPTHDVESDVRAGLEECGCTVVPNSERADFGVSIGWIRDHAPRL